MEFDRRTFLRTVPAAGAVALAGCAGALDSGPDAEAIETLQVESELVSSDRQDSEFTVTVQNTGAAGNVAIGLYWQMRETGAKPSRIGAETDAYSFVRQQETYFDAGERRTVAFTASPPADAVGYYFMARPATYGARVRNSGGEGRVTVVMNYTDSTGLELTEREEVYVDEGATKEVLFDVRPKEGTSWEVTVETDD